MPPAFGFSVGDFIATIELCTKVAKALKDTGGASSEYQSVIIELHGLQNVLARLAALEPTESNLSHVNAIRGMALACRLPLADFFSKLEKYEAAMGPLATSYTLRGAGKKIQWAVFMADEVRKIRAMISAKVISINLLLAMHASETLSRMESYSSSHHQQLFEKLEEHTVCMQKILRGVDDAKNEMLLSHEAIRREASGSSDRLQQGLDNVNVGMENMTQRLSGLSIGFASAHTSLVTLRILSSQIMGFLRSFPTELRTLLNTVIRTNMRMYVMLLSIHERISASPTLLLQSNIRFENALGVTQELPYEWFRSWEIFEGLLRAQFKGAPGACKVDAGHFRLVHAKRPSVSIDRDTWTQAITPRADIIMLMIITDIACQLSSCPRPSCTGKPSFDLGKKEILTCPACSLRFMPQLSAIQGSVGSLNGLEVDQVAKIQVEEDAKLFGSRDLSNFGGKDSPPHTPQVEELPEDVEMPDADDNEFSNAHLNQPTSPPPSEPPIFGWLADTLPPANPGSVMQWREAEEHRQSKRKKQEIDNIEVFRNVQVSVSLESGLSTDLARKAPSDGDELELGARIYYRNIIDRYPLIERFLARRLAEGNWERAKRLAWAQDQAMKHAFSVAQNEMPVQNESDELVDFITDEGHDHILGERQKSPSASSNVYEDIKSSVRPISAAPTPWYNQPFPVLWENFSMPQTYPEFQENYWTQQSVPASPVSSANTPLREVDYDKEQKGPDSTWGYPILEPIAMEKGVTLSEPQLFSDESLLYDEDDRAQQQRKRNRKLSSPPPTPVDLGSVGDEDDRVRKRNRKLSTLPPLPVDLRSVGDEGNFPSLGPPPVDLGSVGDKDNRAQKQRKRNRKLSALPPPPVNFGSVGLAPERRHSFICYICQCQLILSRKREWRRHVVDDLRPYMCPFRDCPGDKETYHRRGELSSHLRYIHDLDWSPQCPFCQCPDSPFLPSPGGIDYYVKHIARHMEEIALGVVTRAYEDWSYDETSSEVTMGCGCKLCNMLELGERLDCKM